jgi:hypothetical protein
MPADSEGAEVTAGRSLAAPAFPDDNGLADEELRRALADLGADHVSALRSARLLVPIVAVADEVDETGADKASHMAVVSMVNATGEKGLLAFTGLDSMHLWDSAARPVPVLGSDAARAALDDGAAALVIDLLGPHRTVVTGPGLSALAAISPADGC